MQKYGYNNSVSISARDDYEKHFIGAPGNDDDHCALGAAVMDCVTEVERLSAALAAKDAENNRIRHALEQLLTDSNGKVRADHWNRAMSALEMNDAPPAPHPAELARVAEQRQGEIERLQRAVEWCLSNHAGHLYEQQNWNDNSQRYEYAWTIQVGSGNQVPEEFQDLIKARETTTGASNG